jgi:phosphate:Na+ symporter
MRSLYLKAKQLKKLKGFSKKYLAIVVLALLGYGLYSSVQLTTILAGIAIFLIGMILMEDGFKALAGGTMQSILKNLTSNLYKSIFGGFLLTSIVQSSSLVSVIAISFISAGFIGLSEAIGIIFGANLGTTTTAWIVAYFGLKIKISAYAMPMLVFGIVLHFFKDNTSKGISNILLGLGLIFLGVGYMKEGFETIQAAIDITQFAMEGFIGLLVYVLVGFVITIVIQSSSATMALILTALATGQITYENSLALAIGANIGTTVTAILGSLTSNADGKRLAIAHLIFNLITGLVAIVFINQIAAATNYLATIFGIEYNNTLKLALFHTIFNILGILLVTPLVAVMVARLNKIFTTEKNQVEAKYLNRELIQSPEISIESIEKEIEHLYKNGFKIISAAIGIKPKAIKKGKELRPLVDDSKVVSIDIDKSYRTLIKPLEVQIAHFSIEASANMSPEQVQRVDELRLASRDVVEAIKDIAHMKKNLDKFQVSTNQYIKSEYALIKEMVANTLRVIDMISKHPEDKDVIKSIAKIKNEQMRLNGIKNKKANRLIQESKIDTEDVISLMNDSTYANDLIYKLCELVENLYINKDENLRKLYSKYQAKYMPTDEAIEAINNNNLEEKCDTDNKQVEKQ